MNVEQIKHYENRIDQLKQERDEWKNLYQQADSNRDTVIAAMESKCAEMRDALSDARCGVSELINLCKRASLGCADREETITKIDRALSTDCGKEVREALESQIKFPDNLSDLTIGLVLRFAQAMADKLSAAQIKHGYGDGWAETTHEWPVPECREALMAHLKKGDPVDVANFCAFLWYHQIGTADCGKEGK